MLSWQLPVDGWRNLHEGHVHAEKRFRMAHEEISVRRKIAAKPVQKPFLCLFIEIDDHVPAENDVHGFSKSKIAVHEVEPSEPDALPQFGDDAINLVARHPCFSKGTSFAAHRG